MIKQITAKANMLHLRMYIIIYVHSHMHTHTHTRNNTLIVEQCTRKTVLHNDLDKEFGITYALFQWAASPQLLLWLSINSFTTQLIPMYEIMIIIDA